MTTMMLLSSKIRITKIAEKFCQEQVTIRTNAKFTVFVGRAGTKL